jgi:RimJ/RimL family protein N-acetyltransferase
MPVLETARLLLRRWCEQDRAAFAALNADPVVMEHFPAPLSRRESDALVDRIEAGLDDRGWGLWAVELREPPEFIGFVGLNPATFEAPFTPAVEVGWRLAREHWGLGYATEGARATLDFGFDKLALDEIVSFTTRENVGSRRGMERLGMRHEAVDDFDNPNVAEGHPLRPHVLYRLDRDSWKAG